MKFIIILIIIFFVWRHFKKKNAYKDEDMQPTPAKPTAKSVSTEPKAEETTAQPYSISEIAKKDSNFEGIPLYPPTPEAIGPRRGTPVSESSLPKKDEPLERGSKDEQNPDYAFACAKARYQKYLDKYKREKFDLSSWRTTPIEVAYWIDAGDRLAQYYERGYGCEQNVQAALDILLQLEEYIHVQMKKETIEDKNEIHVWRAGAGIHLTLAECYACLGKIRESEKYYRMTMAMALSNIFEYHNDRRYFGIHVNLDKETLYSAMGGYPVPANPTLAAELALKLVQHNKVFAAYAMLEIMDLQKMDYRKIGKSLEQDFQVYLDAGLATGSAYAAYKLGQCYLYGRGTTQNVEHGLALLHDASYSRSLNATRRIAIYVSELERRDELQGKRNEVVRWKVSNLERGWDARLEQMENNTQILTIIQNVIDKDPNAESVIGKRVNPEFFSERSDAEENADLEEETLEEVQGDDTFTTGADEFALSSLPFIVYDDSNRQWKRRGIFGDHAEYYNDEGDEVTIYSAQVSGSSASTSAGTLHWY